LAAIKDPRALKPLIALFRGNNSYDSKVAADALNEMGWQFENVEDKITYYCSKQLTYYSDWDEVIKLNYDAAAKALILSLRYQNQPNPFNAWETKELVKIGTPAVAPLITELKNNKPEIRMYAVWTLGEIGAVEAIDPLIELLSDRGEITWREDNDKFGSIGITVHIINALNKIWLSTSLK